MTCLLEKAKQYQQFFGGLFYPCSTNLNTNNKSMKKSSLLLEKKNVQHINIALKYPDEGIRLGNTLGMGLGKITKDTLLQEKLNLKDTQIIFYFYNFDMSDAHW